jgi:hypothetical protein
MIDQLDVNEDTKCINCKHKTTYTAGITYEVCGNHENNAGLSKAPFMIPDNNWFCADFEEIENK